MKKLFPSFIIIISVLVTFYSFPLPVFALDVEVTRAKINTQLGVLIKTIGYGILLFFAFKEIIQEVKNGDVKSAGSSVFKYLIIYAILLGLPKAFMWVEDFIKGL